MAAVQILALPVVVVILMVAMNLRGVKESVLSLLPIFLAFVVMQSCWSATRF